MLWIFLLLFPLFSLSAEGLKTLVLIIATDNLPAYKDLQDIWKSYMNDDPEHFEAYFLRADPKLTEPFVIRPNEIVVKTEEGYAPGILNKTLLAMEAFLPRLDEFDYVLRTNLSSFFPYKNFLKHLETLPRTNCYSGVSVPWYEYSFVSGAGIVLSSDLVRLLVKKHHEFDSAKTLPDDVFIGLFYHKNKVPITCTARWDYPTYEGWLKYNHQIEDFAYHFRAKANYNFRTDKDPHTDELLTLKALLNKYYPPTVSNKIPPI